MNGLPPRPKGQFKQNLPQKINHFFQKTPNKQKRVNHTILLLLHEEKVFECQNNRQMIINTLTTKHRKLTAQKVKLQLNPKYSQHEKALTLTPKFKKHNLSQSKLPPLNRKGKKQLKQLFVKLTPWEQYDRMDLARPFSSKILPY